MSLRLVRALVGCLVNEFTFQDPNCVPYGRARCPAYRWMARRQAYRMDGKKTGLPNGWQEDRPTEWMARCQVYRWMARRQVYRWVDGHTDG